MKTSVSVILLFQSFFVPFENVPVSSLRIKILHNNDLHARFEEVSQAIGVCSKVESKTGKCYGGFARIATAVRNARAENSKIPTFFFNAGDSFAGSHLYQHFKWEVVTKFLNILAPDAVCLGNHEFDNGVEGLVPFLAESKFPIVSANLNWSLVKPEILQVLPKKSHIIKVGNRKIGIIGFLTPSTKYSSHPGKVEFLDEVQSIRQEIQVLKTQKIDIFIGLGHSGYERELEIAKEVEDLDLVIGGHSHTFLYGEGPTPDLEPSEGDYPSVVIQPKTGRKVYVVQAYAYSKYLGNLTIDFDVNGEIVEISGKPILLDSNVKQAEDVLEELKRWKDKIPRNNKIVGYSRVTLVGEKVCRVRECNFGNLIADAMINYRAESLNGTQPGWTDASVALLNSGTIRASIPKKNSCEITFEDLETSYPFRDNLVMVDLDGKKLLEVLEWSVSDSLTENSTVHGGKFLQESGLKIVYNLSELIGSRVVSVKVRCGLCHFPEYEDLDENKMYRVLMRNFIHQGGDGYHMLPILPSTSLNTTILNAVLQYLKRYSPVHPELQDRIKYT